MLPRLLYLGDVPVESSYHGSALLYRLLQQYPADRLHIVEGDLFAARTSRRLAGVRHATLAVGRPRLLHTRFHHWYSRWLLAGAGRRARQVAALLGKFEPEAVLTVGHGYSWVTAARYASQAELPLYLIVHDDWPRSVGVQEQAAVDRAFSAVYRQAAVRFCVSPGMAAAFATRYGASAQVLLPSRASGAVVFDGPAPQVGSPRGHRVFVFAGTLNSPGYVRLLRQLAVSLTRHDASLLIFGPLTADQAAAQGLSQPNVRLGGLLDPDSLLQRLRAEADILFVPMSFAPDDRANMRMGFPSKLTDYTAVGIPLLICGPADCSAVQWADAHPGTAEVVTSDDQAAIDRSVDGLLLDAPRRMSLARQAQLSGSRDFSAGAAAAVLHAALERHGG